MHLPRRDPFREWDDVIVTRDVPEANRIGQLSATIVAHPTALYNAIVVYQRVVVMPISGPVWILASTEQAVARRMRMHRKRSNGWLKRRMG